MRKQHTIHGGVLFILSLLLVGTEACRPPGIPQIAINNDVPLSLSKGKPNGLSFTINNAEGFDTIDAISVLLQQEERTELISAASFTFCDNCKKASIDSNGIPPSILKNFHPGDATLILIIYDPKSDELIHILYLDYQLVD